MTRWPLLTLATLWITLGRRPPEWNRTNHPERVVDCYRSLRIVADSGTREILEASSFYPPMETCAAGFLYLVLPSSLRNSW